MAFTPGDDINFLQATDSPVVGAGAGDDLYIVSPDLLTDGQAVQISDTQGTNTLQLTDGLSIASSQVANDALLLTLSNGAEITLLGSSTFLFDVGGAPLAPAETGMTYGDFVQGVLGVTVPEPGEPPVEIEDPIVIGEDPAVNTIELTPGFIGEIAATDGADLFTFTLADAQALTANTQIQITGFDATEDAIQLVIGADQGAYTLDEIEAEVAAVLAVTNLPFGEGGQLINFGPDADGDPIGITLVGIDTAEATTVNVAVL